MIDSRDNVLHFTLENTPLYETKINLLIISQWAWHL